MPGAGPLRDLLTFQSRANDANGDPIGAWTARFDADADLIFLRGSEPVMAQRLRGVQPVVITVREYTQTRQITSAWRAVDKRDLTRVFEIKSPATPAKEAGFLDILAEMTVEAV